jgi:uncharacterized protein
MMEIDSSKPLLNLDSSFSYTCKICNKCCHNKGIQVNPYETMRLSECLHISTTEFREKYLDNNFLKRKGKSGACIFLDNTGCRVHTNRPLVCRLYPLGRIRLDNGEEFFPELIPHPESKGEYGNGSTVREYLQEQGTIPYLEAESAYRNLIQKMISAAMNLSGVETFESNINLTELTNQEWILDPDPVIMKYCNLKGITFPLEADDKLELHLKALKSWMDGELSLF